ncbi:hypothetical protein [Streptomyces novaecaesareae]|uniref:hypothetical protein n=1 Tax=Streptomyces novaecaesareae TaxID=68244 RepID=UPI0012FEF47A|nr:hypothetical protein [Streptomyces novaecaesareae]
MTTVLAPTPEEAAADRAERLADLMEATSPDTRARQQQADTLPVLEPLRPLVPGGGLAKGTVTEATDTGLLLALAAGPAGADRYGWLAAVGLPDLGLAAAAGYGIDLTRMLVVDDPGTHYAEVLAALAPACPVIIAAAPGRLPPRTADRLAAHLRRAGTVLLTPGPWPGTQLRLEVTAKSWVGLGDGWGQLTGREVEVRSVGRGAAYRPRTARLWLPDENGAVVPAAPGSAAGAGRTGVAAALA